MYNVVCLGGKSGGAGFPPRPRAGFTQYSTGPPALHRAFRFHGGVAEGVPQTDPRAAGGTQIHFLHHLCAARGHGERRVYWSIM